MSNVKYAYRVGLKNKWDCLLQQNIDLESTNNAYHKSHEM